MCGVEKNFSVTILSPEKKIYEGNAISLVVPCATGYWGILADHAPFIANTERGKITLRQPEGQVREIQIEAKGFLEVFKNNVTLLI